MKKLIIVLLVIVSFLLVGCGSNCKSPYIEYKRGNCCLDSNYNGVCDNDEGITISDTKDTKTQKAIVQIPEKEDCPYECCVDDDYTRKICKEYYECKQNRCIVLDTDNDGLTDEQEVSIGTNLKSRDTDGDGLDDALEFNIRKTSPINPNTDGDRYNDGEDKEPLKPNSANIEVDVEKVEGGGLDLELISSSAIALGSTAFGNLAGILGGINLLNNVWDYIKQTDVRTLKFTITNAGDDYSEYVKFDLYVKYVYIKSGKIISQKNIFIKTYKLQEKIEIAQTLEKADVLSKTELTEYINQQLPEPDECSSLLSFCTEEAEYNIQNIEYPIYS